MNPALRANLLSPLPETIAVGQGTALYLEGTCEAPGVRIAELHVAVGSNRSRVVAHGMPPQGRWRPLSSWWAIVSIAPVRSRSTAVLTLHAELRAGPSAQAEIGEVTLTPDDGVDPPPSPRDTEPELAIAMATYEPPPELFQRQVASIRAQTHRDWVCVISDDRSSPAAIEGMRAVLDGDPRFELHMSQDRLGVYRNFERALRLTPAGARYCALCDQDDRWYPEKLEALVARLGPSVHLAYSDTRIVSEEGTRIADTYWTHRRNNHTDLGSLLLANTVTGAASVFTRELLDQALPFPPRYLDAYHDHWIALCALALGEIAYVPEPLYDYVQHADSVIGYEEANLPGEKFRRRRVRARAASKGLSVPHLVYSALRRYYFSVWCQSMVWAMALKARCGAQMTARDLGTAERLSSERNFSLFAWLARRSLRPRLASSATFGRERYVLMALVWRRLVAAWARVSG